jgi:hypothetical protein
MKTSKYLMIKSLKYAIIIGVILTAIFIISGFLFPIHSEIFEFLCMSVYLGFITTQAIIPGVLDISFFLTVFFVSVFQVIYLWIIVFAIFVLIEIRKRRKS